MANPVAIDKRTARTQFSRAAAVYDDVAVLQHEIAERLIQRLDYIVCEPKVILDIGCGTGRAIDALMKRYPKAKVVALDFSLPMLQKSAKRGRWLKRPACLCADMDQLPLAASSVDLVFSSSAFQWTSDVSAVFKEIQRVIKPQGLLMFSSFGPDTLKELREAWSQVDGLPHVHHFLDMHDYGDALVGAQFMDPVMDREDMTLTYESVERLLKDLKQAGVTNADTQRRKGLLGKDRLQQLKAAYEMHRCDERLPLSYEVIYGHAWGAVQQKQEGVVMVSPESLRKS